MSLSKKLNVDYKRMSGMARRRQVILQLEHKAETLLLPSNRKKIAEVVKILKAIQARPNLPNKAKEAMFSHALTKLNKSSDNGTGER